MIAFHISAILLALLFGWTLGKSKYLWVIATIAHAVSYPIIFLMTFTGFEDQTYEIGIIAASISVGCTTLAALVRKKKWKIALVPAVIVVLAFTYEMWSEIPGHIRHFLYDPISISESDTTIIWHYRFKPDYIVKKPANISEAMVLLDSILAASGRSIEEFDIVEEHFGLGLWMRNNWGLHSGKSGIYKELDSMGIQSGDNMSAYLLETYKKNQSKMETERDSINKADKKWINRRRK